MKLLIVLALAGLSVAAPQEYRDVQILRQESEQSDDGLSYRYALEQDDGTSAQQEGQVVPGPEPETGSLSAQGGFQFVADDGNTYSVTYEADERGFQPQGSHLPVGPEQIAAYAELREDHPELFWAESN